MGDQAIEKNTELMQFSLVQAAENLAVAPQHDEPEPQHDVLFTA